MREYYCIFVLLIVALVKAQAPFKWATCGSGSFTPSNVTMSPYPARAGQSVTVTSAGTGSKTVTGGTWRTDVMFNGVVVQSLTGPVCALIHDCPCPCAPGFHVSSQTVPVTSIAPSGGYTGKYTATNGDGSPIVCLQYSFQVGN